MKKSIILTVFLFITFISFAQNTVFDKYEDNPLVQSIIVNKTMFQMMSKVKADSKDKELQQYFNLLKKLDNLKVFTTSNIKLGADMKATVNSYLKSNPLEELMRVNSDGKNVKIYVKSNANENAIRELLMFIEGANMKDASTIVLSLTGNFNLDEISILTEKMNLPGGEDLKKASKK